MSEPAKQYRYDPSLRTFEDIEAPWAHVIHEEQTGVVPGGIVDTVWRDVSGGYAEFLPYRERCCDLEFYSQVRFVMGERRQALSGEVMEVCGPPAFRHLRLLRERIKEVQGRMHSLWKTLGLKGHRVAEGSLVSAHMDLTDVDSEIREQQRELFPERTDADK